MNLAEYKEKLDKAESALKDAQAERKMLMKRLEEEGFNNLDDLLKEEKKVRKELKEKQDIFNEKCSEFLEEFGDDLDEY